VTNAAVAGRVIERVERRGKYLLLILSNHQVLAIHLRMTGQLTVVPQTAEVPKATYFIVHLDNHTELRFNDTRKFGKVILYRDNAPPAGLKKLGPEPLAKSFTPAVLKKRFGKRELAVKKALLNQEIVAGIGNIYADEALFLAGIDPVRPVNTLTDPEMNKLVKAIRQVLREGIDHRGTTKRDYLDGEGHPGSHQDYLRVYGRKGMPCPVCGTPVAKINFGGRGTHFCPKCQG
jgi:formamidopyrimidine-DNA glycosylase